MTLARSVAIWAGIETGRFLKQRFAARTALRGNRNVTLTNDQVVPVEPFLYLNLEYNCYLFRIFAQRSE